MLESAQPAIRVAPLTPGERLATLEAQQRGVLATLESHAGVHQRLSDGINALVGSVSKMQRNLVIAAVVVFGGTENGSDLAQILAKLWT